MFIDLLERIFTWDSHERLTAQDALRHEWILEGLPPNILIHHMNLHKIALDELPKNIRVKVEEYKAQNDNLEVESVDSKTVTPRGLKLSSDLGTVRSAKEV